MGSYLEILFFNFHLGKYIVLVKVLRMNWNTW